MKANNLSLLVVLLSTMISINAQQKKLEYNIKRNGDVVGNIHFVQGIVGNRIVLTMESEVNTRFIFNFKANAKEEVIYDNGIMVWSSIFRKLNGNVKVNKKTKANGNAYTVYKGSKTETLNDYPIRYNILSVYISEPANITKVYSDNFQQQIDIQKIADHHYKIKFPDGNYNEYFYINGVCSKIEIHHSMYSATIELKS
ncbi:MAG TPA: DUF6134 family protein [Chitinophagaceae bacterium]|nr:DUF6134 family protein [Chitinophagaceae bacterium]